MQVERSASDALAVNKLPDGSAVIVDSNNQTVFALNPTASAAWDACSHPTTLSEITKEMQQSFDPDVTEEVAQEAILQLQEQKLVKMSGKSLASASRREFIAKLGTAAAVLPLVVSLPIAEQRAYALRAKSTVPTAPPPPPSNGGGGSGGSGGLLGWLLGLLGL
ncbi:MAG TPA: PqqD family protein [Pseudacidobacterium sp.]|jgi:hypothetical protein|nr:PqqD family protein [Pseudacidobacterium sp.]